MPDAAARSYTHAACMFSYKFHEWIAEACLRYEPDGSANIWFHSTVFGGFDGRLCIVQLGVNPTKEIIEAIKAAQFPVSHTAFMFKNEGLYQVPMITTDAPIGAVRWT